MAVSDVYRCILEEICVAKSYGTDREEAGIAPSEVQTYQCPCSRYPSQ